MGLSNTVDALWWHIFGSEQRPKGLDACLDEIYELLGGTEEAPGGLLKRMDDLDRCVGDACLRHRGPHREGMTLEPGDVVTRQGCQWLTKRKTNQKPELSKQDENNTREDADFWLLVKRGRDGRPEVRVRTCTRQRLPGVRLHWLKSLKDLT